MIMGLESGGRQRIALPHPLRGALPAEAAERALRPIAEGFDRIPRKPVVSVRDLYDWSPPPKARRA